MELAPRCWLTSQDSRACTLAGDFDGDDKPDVAVLVQSKGCTRDPDGACRVVGIAFLLGSGRCEILGAGRGSWRRVADANAPLGPSRRLAPDQFTAGAGASWSWNVWQLTPQGPRPREGSRPHPSGRPPGMRRDAIALSGGDASVLLYRSPKGWVRYELGF